MSRRLVASRSHGRTVAMLGASFGAWRARAMHSARTATQLGRFAEARRREALAASFDAWQAQARQRAAKRAVLTIARRRIDRIRCFINAIPLFPMPLPQ